MSSITMRRDRLIEICGEGADQLAKTQEWLSRCSGQAQKVAIADMPGRNGGASHSVAACARTKE